MLMLCNDCLQLECICNIKYDKLTVCVICGALFEAHTSYGLCKRCWASDKLREWDRLQSETARAQRKGLPVTLTLVQWLNTVSDFRGCCAWCEKVGYSNIEMLVPENGLVWHNAVPSCRSCSVHHRNGFENAEQRVKEYLMANSGKEEDVANLEYFYEENELKG
jgi:hypothetical protein